MSKHREGGSRSVWVEYSEWQKVYCIFPKKIMNTNEKRRGTLYKRKVEVDDCGEHRISTNYIDEKTYFMLKLKGEHKAKSFAG